MTNTIQSIALNKLMPHPDNPNRMSKANFARLVRNIKRTGRYEPIVVRPHPTRKGRFEIINGHHRWKALAQLDYNRADCVVWQVSNEQVDILLATLNRLGGSDELGKKLALLKRLNKKLRTDELAKLIPQTAKQLEILTNLKKPSAAAKIMAKSFAAPLVFFMDDRQQQIVEDALSLAADTGEGKTKAAKKTTALVHIAQYFLDNSG